MKILVIGFPRSGTSLTYRIFRRHEDVVRMYYESLLLWRHRNKNINNLFKEFKSKQSCGEKIIYEKPFVGKKKDYTFIDYCNDWNDLYGDDARIIQVVRHPYDSWNSIIQKKYVARRIPQYVCSNLRKYFKCVPQYTQEIMNFPNSFTFKMEHLIESPDEILNKLYTHCDLNPKRSKFNEPIKNGKAFNYKRKGFFIDNDSRVQHQREEFWKIMNKNLPGLLKVMNKIDGPEYEV